MKRLSLLFLFCSGCSNQAIYDNVQLNRRNECLKEPTLRYYEECMARTQMSYEEYERLRQETLAAGKTAEQP